MNAKRWVGRGIVAAAAVAVVGIGTAGTASAEGISLPSGGGKGGLTTDPGPLQTGSRPCIVSYEGEDIGVVESGTTGYVQGPTGDTVAVGCADGYGTFQFVPMTAPLTPAGGAYA